MLPHIAHCHEEKILTTEQLRDIIPVNNSRRRMSLKMEDTVKNRTCSKRPFAWYVEKPSAKDYLLTVFIFAVCTLIGLLFQKLDFTDTNIVTIYILGV